MSEYTRTEDTDSSFWLHVSWIVYKNFSDFRVEFSDLPQINSFQKHPFVGDAESSKIDRGKTVVEWVFYIVWAHSLASLLLLIRPLVKSITNGRMSDPENDFSKKTLRRIPFRAMLTTVPIWAVWIGSLGNFAAVELMFLYNPTYMKKGMAGYCPMRLLNYNSMFQSHRSMYQSFGNMSEVFESWSFAVLKMTTAQVGLASALPPLIQFLVKVVCGMPLNQQILWTLFWISFAKQISRRFSHSGALSDRIKFVSEVVKFRCFNTFAFLGCAACFIALAIIDAETPVWTFIMIISYITIIVNHHQLLHTKAYISLRVFWRKWRVGMCKR